MTKENTTKTDIAIISTKLDAVKSIVDNIERKLEADYVTKQEFDPIKKGFYGVVGLILTAVVGALVALVIQK